MHERAHPRKRDRGLWWPTGILAHGVDTLSIMDNYFETVSGFSILFHGCAAVVLMGNVQTSLAE
jgi:hypothetical protein